MPGVANDNTHCNTYVALSAQIELLSVRDQAQEAAAPVPVVHDEENVIRVYEGLAAAQQALSQDVGGGGTAGVGGGGQEDSAQSLREAAEEAMAAGSAVFAFPGSAWLHLGEVQLLKPLVPFACICPWSAC